MAEPSMPGNCPGGDGLVRKPWWPGHPLVDDSKPELHATVSLRSPDLHVLALDLSK